MLDPVKYKNLNYSSLTKFQNILGYQIELGCDTALAKGMNASTNAGYEVVLGIVSSSD